ncbi:MAG: hypothetical protein K6G83_13110 [Lachnospiraceae bacterium]|nr:hypothetical protein [Lachnospiraceae bacterium]
MEIIIWLMIMTPCSMLITGIGIYAWKRRKPMWFWSGTTVSEDEISDIPAYNRANGIMWICYSLIFWLSTIAGFWSMNMAAWGLMTGCLIGTPILIIAYRQIYGRYKKNNRTEEQRNET